MKNSVREIFQQYQVRTEREIFENQQDITTLTVIWARQLVSPQPKLAGAGPVAERARADEFDAVGFSLFRGDIIRDPKKSG